MPGLPLFKLGKIVATPGALDVMNSAGVDTAIQLLRRHLVGDWGDLSDEDKQANDAAVKNGDERILSSYNLRVYVTPTELGYQKIWILTEADRSSTCIELPGEY